ncbi:MAG: hypothetical protein ACR2Q4_00035 [Geminicoccaceae bacterium]
MSQKTFDRIEIDRKTLQRAVEHGVITADQGDGLWHFIERDRTTAAPSPTTPTLTTTPSFDVAHLLWYTGALIIIGAMGLFSTLAFSTWGGGALVVTGIIYAALFVGLGHGLWQRGLLVPGGLCLTVAVSMAPLIVFGVQEAAGWWTHGDPGAYRDFYRWIKGSWLMMELATIAAGIAALTRYRFPFLAAPVAVALWFMSMDLVPWIFGEDWNSWDQRRVVSLWFGLGMLGIAWWVDVRARGDFAFWLHLFGLLAFWGGLSSMNSDSEVAKAIYCLINIILLAMAIFLQRRAYAVFGALGVAYYLGHLAELFENSLVYPFALSLIGLLILGAGLVYYRKQPAIEEALRRYLPNALQQLRPAHTR